MRPHGHNQIMQPTHSQQNRYRLLTIVTSCDSFPKQMGRDKEMRDSASQAQHYYDLALEFLVMTRFAAAADIRETYRMMGQHYLARAGATLARAKLERNCPEPQGP
jgi:hypothetical protein